MSPAALHLVERLGAAAGLAGWWFVTLALAWAAGELLGEAFA